jgi:hypothetical protein
MLLGLVKIISAKEWGTMLLNGLIMTLRKIILLGLHYGTAMMVMVAQLQWMLSHELIVGLIP